MHGWALVIPRSSRTTYNPGWMNSFCAGIQIPQTKRATCLINWPPLPRETITHSIRRQPKDAATVPITVLWLRIENVLCSVRFNMENWKKCNSTQERLGERRRKEAPLNSWSTSTRHTHTREKKVKVQKFPTCSCLDRLITCMQEASAASFLWHRDMTGGRGELKTLGYLGS